MCPEYEKLRRAYVKATHEFKEMLSPAPTKADGVITIDEAAAPKSWLRERALAHRRTCLRCENSKPPQ